MNIIQENLTSTTIVFKFFVTANSSPGNISVTGQLKSGKLQDSDTYEKFNHISNIVTGISIGIAAIFLVLVYFFPIGPDGGIVDIVRMIFAFLVGMVLISYYKGNK